MWKQGNLSASVGQRVATRRGELNGGCMDIKGARSSGPMMTGKGVGSHAVN